MKILVRLFLIILVMFSCAKATEAALKALYDNKIIEYQKEISTQQNYVVKFEQRAKISADPIIKNRYLSFANSYKSNAQAFSNKLDNLKNNYKKSASEVYKTLYTENVKNKKNFIDRLKRTPVMFLRNKEAQLKQAENELSTLDSNYSAYLKSLNTKKNKVAATTKNSSNQKIILSTSNLNTNTKIGNVNVSGKAKASVGSISIGKEEK